MRYSQVQPFTPPGNLLLFIPSTQLMPDPPPENTNVDPDDDKPPKPGGNPPKENTPNHPKGK